MKCPACSGELSSVTAGGVQLDVCQQSCGGVWFDAGELEKLDEREEAAAPQVLRPVRNQQVAVDRMKSRLCPKCSSGDAKTELKKHLHDAQYNIEIDSCPQCGGVWLDLGELESLRAHNSDEASRQKVIDDFASRAAVDGSIPSRLRAVLRVLF